MKSLLLSVAVVAVIMSACSKEFTPPPQTVAKQPPPAVPELVPAPVLAPPAGEMTIQLEKEKAMEAAKAAAASAGKRE